MKKKNIILLTVILSMVIMSACGKNSTTKEIETKEITVTEDSTPSTVNDNEVVADIKEEDVVGDTDVSGGSITMDMMTEQIIGTDILCTENSGTNAADFGKQVTVLFPDKMYITNQTNFVTAVDRTNTIIDIQPIFNTDVSICSINEENGDVQVGNYLMQKDIQLKNKNRMAGIEYIVTNLNNGVFLQINIVIRSKDESDISSLTEEYTSKFEETLLKSLE